jgi:hypothetical protein
MEMKNTFKILVTNPEGKRPLGSFNYSLRVILKLILKETGCGWIQMTQDKCQVLVNTPLNVQAP